MITETVNIRLVKEDEDEFYNVGTVNGNLDKIDEEFGRKVDKIEGKRLSSNDYTDDEKEKLKNIDENANNYIHPTAAGSKHIPSGGASGQVLKYGGSSGTASWGNDGYYGTCSTAAGTAAKTVSLSGFSLFTGATVAVMFSNGNAAANPTLNVNGTGAKAIYYRNAALTSSMAGIISQNGVYLFVYSGSYWRLIGDVGNIAASEVADSLKTPRSIDGVRFDGSADITHFGVCETALDVVEKVVSISGFELKEGAKVSVFFKNGNSSSYPCLNINGTGKFGIHRRTGNNSASPVFADAIGFGVYEFIYFEKTWYVIEATMDNYIKFDSYDVNDTGWFSWESVNKLISGERLRDILSKISKMFKNVRYLYNLLGKTSISSIGDGTVTGAVSKLHTDLSDLNAKSHSGWFVQEIGNMVEINTVSPLTVSGTLSESTGTYFARALLTVPAQIRPADSTYMNVQSTVQSAGVLNSTFVDYNAASGTLIFHIATWKPFQNTSVKLHVRIRYNK